VVLQKEGCKRLWGGDLEKIHRQKRYGGGRFRPAPFIPTHFAGWREIRPSLACESKIPMLTPSLPLYHTPVHGFMQIWLKTGCNPHRYLKSSVCNFGYKWHFRRYSGQVYYSLETNKAYSRICLELEGFPVPPVSRYNTPFAWMMVQSTVFKLMKELFE
jgi:hypothetical protein